MCRVRTRQICRVLAIRGLGGLPLLLAEYPVDVRVVYPRLRPGDHARTPEFVEKANKTLAAINAAYDRIEKERNLK